MTVYTRCLLSRVYLAVRAYPCWDDALILGHSHLANFDIETPPPVYDCCFRWIIESLTPWVQSSQHTWSNLGTHFPLLHTHTSYIGPCYSCTHLIRALHLLSPHISSSCRTLSSSLDQKEIQTSLELSGWVFTCLWTLGSISSVMVVPVRLLIHLWWCTHIDSWHVVSWFVYISDLEFWSTFVWAIILVLLCQHSFNDVWSCFSICSLRLCMCFSLHRRWAYPRVSYMVRFCVLC